MIIVSINFLKISLENDRNMDEGKHMTLAEMDAGQQGTIIQVEGGHRLTHRLASMGVRPGKIVTKVSSMVIRGPVTIKIDNSQIALGRGMANKIYIELESK